MTTAASLKQDVHEIFVDLRRIEGHLRTAREGLTGRQGIARERQALEYAHRQLVETQGKARHVEDVLGGTGS